MTEPHSTRMFVNLPVKDLPATMAFFRHLGFAFEPRFTNDKAACMVISEWNYAMLLTEPFFQGFTAKAICDSAASTEVLIALSMESRARVDEMAALAAEAGGKVEAEPKDYGFMYQRAFEDPDGHNWEIFFMEPADAAEGAHG